MNLCVVLQKGFRLKEDMFVKWNSIDQIQLNGTLKQFFFYRLCFLSFLFFLHFNALYLFWSPKSSSVIDKAWQRESKGREGGRGFQVPGSDPKIVVFSGMEIMRKTPETFRVAKLKHCDVKSGHFKCVLIAFISVMNTLYLLRSLSQGKYRDLLDQDLCRRIWSRTSNRPIVRDRHFFVIFLFMNYGTRLCK